MMNPEGLWNDFKDSMTEDYKHQGIPDLEAEYLAREEINDNIIVLGGSYETFALPMKDHIKDVNMMLINDFKNKLFES